MKAVHVRKGLDVPLAGEPQQQVAAAPSPTHVAVLAADFHGMKPRLLVRQGDPVKRGQKLFEDRKTPGVFHCAPGAGVVSAVNRGEFRALQSIVIELSEAEQAGDEERVEHARFESYTGKPVAELSGDEARALLIESGLWTAIRTRPFSRTPSPGSKPAVILVSAIDTRPLAASPEKALEGRMEDFHAGLQALSLLGDGPCHLVRKKGSSIDAGKGSRFQVSEFSGPHPAGLPGTHLHFLDPVHRHKVGWIVGYQDVAAIGALVRTGRLDPVRVISLAGPPVKNPRLLRTRLGASLDTLTAGQLQDGELRVISGCVLAGRAAFGPIFGYLGRFHDQVSVLAEDRERVMFGWLLPGADRFTNIPIYLGNLLKGKRFAMGTSAHGEVRAMVPIGLYEQVMPLDIEPTFLLRSLQIGDIEQSEALGCLELDEEDLALCTFACANKINHQGALRDMLDAIWKEGA